MHQRIAVVTPHHAGVPPHWLRECHASVLGQSHPCQHVLVADGPVPESPAIPAATRLQLPRRSNDYGDTPRAAGAEYAVTRGFDGIAFLDADNWYAPGHVASLLELHRTTGATVLTSARVLHRLDGSVLGPCFEVDGERFVDTSCLLLLRAAFPLAALWGSIPERFHAIGDRIFWAAVVRSGIARAHCARPTVAYRTAFRHHYLHFGEDPPQGSKDGEEIGRSLREYLARESAA